MTMDISIGGRSESWIGNTDVISLRVSPHYFETIGTPVLRGRPLPSRTRLHRRMWRSSMTPSPTHSFPGKIHSESASAFPVWPRLRL